MAGSMDAVVRFIGDTSKLQSDLKDVEGAGNKLGQSFRSLARGAATVFGGVAVGAFAKDAVQAASDMAESQNKLQAVFGTSSREIRKALGGIVADTLGSTKLAVDAAGTFGNMFTQMGLAGDQAVTFSKGMLTLTADLVSFHNADPTEVVQALGSAFSGEYDSVQKWIPTITAAAVEQQALAETGKTSADQLTAGEKAAATYTLMMQGAGKATGDAAATAESASNKQRKLHRDFEDMSVQIGQVLLPILSQLLPVLSSMLTVFSNMDGPLQNSTVALAAFGAVALAVGGTVGLVVAAVAAIGVAAYLVWTEWDQIWNWIKDHPAYAVIISILAAPIAWFVLIIGGLKALWDNWDSIWGWISTAAEDAWDAVVTAAEDAWAFIQSIPSLIGGAFASLWAILTAPFITAWNTIVSTWNAVYGFFAGIVSSIASALSGVVDAITAPFQAAWNIVKGIAETIGGAIDTAKGLYNRFAKTWNGIEVKVPSIDIGPVHIGGETIGLPDLPLLAKGGIVTGPTLAMIGERGPEAVIPLRGGGFGNTYNITVEVAAGVNPAAVGAATVDAIRQYERVAGKAWRA